MFTFVPLAQAPHTLSSKASYPSHDLSLRHHHSHHTPSRHTQPIFPFVDDDSFSSSELYASRQRYYEALAEARAAEAEYFQAQARARAEEARVERQRALQAAARQRAYEGEVARRVRAREIEERLQRAKALQVERERTKKIELLRRQIFGLPDNEASACDPCGLCQQSQPQTSARHEEQEALRAFFEFFHGASPAYKVCSPSHLVLILLSDVSLDIQPTSAQTERVPTPTTPSSSSMRPTAVPERPIESRSAVPNSSPKPDEDALARFVSYLFGVSLDDAKKMSPVKSGSPAPHAAASVPTPTLTETKPVTTSKIQEEKSAEVDALKIFAEMFGLRPALVTSNQTEQKPASPSTTVRLSYTGAFD